MLAGRSGRTTAGTNSVPASPSGEGSTRNCRRHVVSSDREMPYRRAVDETSRDPLRLSVTIRSFSSSVQCRRRPVSTTSRCSITALHLGTAISAVLYPLGLTKQGGPRRRGTGQTVCLPQMVGTPADVTDQLEAYFDFVGGDGFIFAIYSRGRSTSSSTCWCRTAAARAVRVRAARLSRSG